MGFSDKVKNISVDIQNGAKNATQTLFHISLRLISGFFIGLVLSLIIQEFFHLGTFSLIFMTVFFISLIYFLLSKLSLLQIVVFDVICVLVGALLRMYVLVAPN